jgi:hypothetical protein
MPYVSKAEQERARWMTLREALTHIKTVEECNLRAAWDQLRETIGDQEAKVRWADVSLELSSIDGGHYIEEDDVPPTEKGFWQSARVIFSGQGSVLDDPACRRKTIRLNLIRESRLHYRPLLVLREDVLRHWLGRSAEDLSNMESAASKPIRKPGRPSARDLVRQTLNLMRSAGTNLNLPHKHLANLVAQENGKKLGDRGWNERTVVQHISEWLEENGLS